MEKLFKEEVLKLVMSGSLDLSKVFMNPSFKELSVRDAYLFFQTELRENMDTCIGRGIVDNVFDINVLDSLNIDKKTYDRIYKILIEREETLSLIRSRLKRDVEVLCGKGLIIYRSQDFKTRDLFEMEGTLSQLNTALAKGGHSPSSSEFTVLFNMGKTLEERVNFAVRLAKTDLKKLIKKSLNLEGITSIHDINSLDMKFISIHMDVAKNTLCSKAS